MTAASRRQPADCRGSQATFVPDAGGLLQRRSVGVDIACHTEVLQAVRSSTTHRSVWLPSAVLHTKTEALAFERPGPSPVHRSGPSPNPFVRPSRPRRSEATPGSGSQRLAPDETEASSHTVETRRGRSPSANRGALQDRSPSMRRMMLFLAEAVLCIGDARRGRSLSVHRWCSFGPKPFSAPGQPKLDRWATNGEPFVLPHRSGCLRVS